MESISGGKERVSGYAVRAVNTTCEASSHLSRGQQQGEHQRSVCLARGPLIRGQTIHVDRAEAKTLRWVGPRSARANDVGQWRETATVSVVAEHRRRPPGRRARDSVFCAAEIKALLSMAIGRLASWYSDVPLAPSAKRLPC